MENNQEMREEVQVLVPTEEALKNLREAFEPIAQAFREIAERILNFISEKRELIKQVAVKWYQLEEEKRVVVRQHHKRDFSRQKISHQVVNRKPQHMVRKIIR